MSQSTSFVFSDAVYLFGSTTFASAPSWRDSEELPDGTKVSQKNLAVQAVLAAFAYLYKHKVIDFVPEEEKILFRKKKTAKVKKLQSTAPVLRGLELVIFYSIRDNSDIYDITKRSIPRSSNPWREVLQIVKESLLDRRILKLVAKGKVLFITQYKYVVNGDISKVEKQVTELKKTLEELQSKGELYEIILSAIKYGFVSQVVDAG